MALKFVQSRLWAAAAGLTVCAWAANVHAGITYISPKASAAAQSYLSNDSDSATGAGPLVVDAQSSRSASGSMASAKATGEYVLDQTGFRGDTVVSGMTATEPGAPLDSSNQSDAETFLKLSFSIDQAYRATFSSSTVVVSNENTRESDQTVALISTEPGAFPLINTIMLGSPNGTYLLEPGTYNFRSFRVPSGYLSKSAEK